MTLMAGTTRLGQEEGPGADALDFQWLLKSMVRD